VLTAIPAEQTGPLLAGRAPILAAEAYAARAAPCWTAMVAFAEALDPGFDGAELDGPMAWAARERSKPGRPVVEAWTLQASPEWTRAHLEDDATSVAATLSTAFRERFDAPAPVHLAAHRWRYARVETAIGTAFTWDATLGIGTCGDWRLGPRVEAAWRSGRALGEAVAARL
jgi:predicted NAD/FAD-dependent oxidoreductase